jgi:hypothetical protein
MITTNANPALEKAIETVKVEVVADPKGCGDLFNPVGTRVFTAPCDTARAYLSQQSVKYSTTLYGRFAGEDRRQRQGRGLHRRQDFESGVAGRGPGRRLSQGGDAAIVKMSNPFDIFRPQVAAIIGLLFILVIYVTMVYGPIAAMLVELFPTRIRYTSMSLPYHIGNGWFGGLLPATAFAIVASTGDIYAGLWYPIIFRNDHRGRRLHLPAGDQGRRHHRSNPARPETDENKSRPRSNPRPILLLSADAAHELQDDLAQVRPGAMLGDVNALPCARVPFSPFSTWDLQRVAVSMVLICAGMSSGPSVSCTQPAFLRVPDGSRPWSDPAAPMDRHFPGSSATPRCGG